MTTPLGDRPDNPRARAPAGSEVSRLSVGSFAFLSTLEPKGKADLLEHLQHLTGVPGLRKPRDQRRRAVQNKNSNGKALHHGEALESTLNRGYRSMLTRALRLNAAPDSPAPGQRWRRNSFSREGYGRQLAVLVLQICTACPQATGAGAGIHKINKSLRGPHSLTRPTAAREQTFRDRCFGPQKAKFANAPWRAHSSLEPQRDSWCA